MPVRDASAARRYGRIANDFLHDMATGTWFACLLVAASLRPYLAEGGVAVRSALGVVSALALGALVVLAVSGGLRLAYWRSRTASADLAAKRRLLVAKHAVFAVVYGLGTWWLLSLGR